MAKKDEKKKNEGEEEKVETSEANAEKKETTEEKKEASVKETSKESTSKETVEEKKVEEPAKDESRKGETKVSEKEKGHLVEAAETIEEGAKVVSDFTSTVFGKVKEGISKAIETGTKLAKEIQETTHDYVEKYKDKYEMKKLNEERLKLMAKLGAFIYTKYESDKELKESQEAIELIKEIEEIDEKIISLGKELDELEEKED